MKFSIVPIAFLASLTIAKAQSTTAADSMESQIAGQQAKQSPEQRQVVVRQTKPNEMKLGSVTCDGIAVQLVKTDNPLQLINPAAPAQYGSPEQNVARDPMNGKVTGLKLFAVNF